MRHSLLPTDQYGDAQALQVFIRHTRDAAYARRLTAIRYRMLGKSATETCTLSGISASTLRSWIHTWNEGGPDALRTQSRPGRPRKLDADIKDLVIERIEGVDREGKPYTAIAIHGYLKKTK